MHDVTIYPFKDKDNEYATPCEFSFDTYEETSAFLDTVFMHGDDLCIEIHFTHEGE